MKLWDTLALNSSGHKLCMYFIVLYLTGIYITNLCSSYFALVVYKFCSLGHKNLLKAEQPLDLLVEQEIFHDRCFARHYRTPKACSLECRRSLNEADVKI